MNLENKVYTLKLVNADELVGKIVSSDSTTVTIENPLSAVPTDKGIQLIYAIFTADPSKTVTLNKSSIVMACETREEVSDTYLEMTTGIKPVRKPQILMS